MKTSKRSPIHFIINIINNNLNSASRGVILFVVLLLFTADGCKKFDDTDLNNPSLSSLSDAAISDLNAVVTGTESGMRENYYFYIDDAGMVGREFYRYSSADPRYTQDLLGGGTSVLDNNTFYITNPWISRYRCVKNCNILIESAGSSSHVTAGERNGYIAFAKTIKALELLINLNLTYDQSIRIDVSNPDALGPFVSKDDALTAIAGLLNEAKDLLQASGTTFAFQLSSGFTGFDDAAGFLKFNRALAARVAVYRQQWNEALTDLNESFLVLTGVFNLGVYMVFSTGTGDQPSNLFFPADATGELRVAHPSFATDAESGDDRLNKTPLRSSPAVLGSSGLSSDRDVLVYSSLYDKVGVIRNEELILIYAEAKIQTGDNASAISALNTIRTAHQLGAYSGGTTQAELIDEMLKQRRYSLFFEGHRWIDMRRYNKLNLLPIDRPGDDVWNNFPIPLPEIQG